MSHISRKFPQSIVINLSLYNVILEQIRRKLINKNDYKIKATNNNHKQRLLIYNSISEQNDEREFILILNN